VKPLSSLEEESPKIVVLPMMRRANPVAGVPSSCTQPSTSPRRRQSAVENYLPEADLQFSLNSSLSLAESLLLGAQFAKAHPQLLNPTV